MKANDAESRYRDAKKKYTHLGVTFRISFDLEGFRSTIYFLDETRIINAGFEERDKLVIISEQQIEEKLNHERS